MKNRPLRAAGLQLRHLNLWCGPAHFAPAWPPPSADPPQPDPDFPIDPDPLPDYEHLITD